MIGSSATSFVMILIGFIFFFVFRPSKRFQIILALSVGYAFLLNGQWALLILGLTTLNYFVPRFLNHRPFAYTVMALVNILVWALFKVDIGSLAWIFPLGFSIFIFQQLTYLLGRDIDRTASFDEYLGFSTFFGNIATGPIFDYSDFSAQFKKRIYLNSENLYLGLVVFMLGFAKKVVFADSFSQVTVYLFDTHRNFSGNLLFPFLLNKYEIYLNFLAFSEMAIGVSLIFGFRLKINFNRPFATTSIMEFWRRWHITLVDWIRKYVFYPLLVSPFSKVGPSGLLLVIFLIFALWHDFTLNHVLYGLIQFVLVFADSRFGARFSVSDAGIWKRGLIFFKWIFFYVVLISIPGLIFRSQDLGNVGRILMNLVSVDLSTSWSVFKLSQHGGWTILIFVALNELIESRLDVKKLALFIRNSGVVLKMLMLFVYLTIIFYFGMWEDLRHFVYSTY